MTGIGMRSRGRRSSKRAAKRNESAAESDRSAFRALCRVLGFWRVCGKRPCRRALDCKGDVDICFRTFWWQMPEENRVWIRAAIRASADGLGNKAVAEAAAAEADRWRALQARYAPKADAAEVRERPVETPEADRVAIPRIRSL